jgi:hypothetical protein
MTRSWHGRLRHIALSTGSVLARRLAQVCGSDAMTLRASSEPPRGGIERRVDAITADVVQVGIVFMTVFGRDNADAFFRVADIDPAVYRRIIAGRFRRVGRGGDPEPESMPA